MKNKSIPQWRAWTFHQLIPNIGSIVVMAAMLFAYDARAANLNVGASLSTFSYQERLSTASGQRSTSVWG